MENDKVSLKFGTSFIFFKDFCLWLCSRLFFQSVFLRYVYFLCKWRSDAIWNLPSFHGSSYFEAFCLSMFSEKVIVIGDSKTCCPFKRDENFETRFTMMRGSEVRATSIFHTWYCLLCLMIQLLAGTCFPKKLTSKWQKRFKLWFSVTNKNTQTHTWALFRTRRYFTGDWILPCCLSLNLTLKWMGSMYHQHLGLLQPVPFSMLTTPRRLIAESNGSPWQILGDI